MVTLISTRKSCKFVDNSMDVAVVTISLSQQSPAVDVVFPTSKDACAFANRCHEDEKFAQSVCQYLIGSSDR